MKSIETIIDELKNHPDFLTAEIFLKSRVVEYIKEEIENEDDVELYEPSITNWVKQNSHTIIENIHDVLYVGYEYGNPFEESVNLFRKKFLEELETNS
jgi:hypothetical protein